MSVVKSLADRFASLNSGTNLEPSIKKLKPYCTKCGEPIPRKNKYCGNCGSSFEQSAGTRNVNVRTSANTKLLLQRRYVEPKIKRASERHGLSQQERKDVLSVAERIKSLQKAFEVDPTNKDSYKPVTAESKLRKKRTKNPKSGSRQFSSIPSNNRKPHTEWKRLTEVTSECKEIDNLLIIGDTKIVLAENSDISSNILSNPPDRPPPTPSGYVGGPPKRSPPTPSGYSKKTGPQDSFETSIWDKPPEHSPCVANSYTMRDNDDEKLIDFLEDLPRRPKISSVPVNYGKVSHSRPKLHSTKQPCKLQATVPVRQSTVPLTRNKPIIASKFSGMYRAVTAPNLYRPGPKLYGVGKPLKPLNENRFSQGNALKNEGNSKSEISPKRMTSERSSLSTTTSIISNRSDLPPIPSMPAPEVPLKT